MASKFELSISDQYVAHWGIVEGVREFIQNALDQRAQDPGNWMSIEHVPETDQLVISNKKSKLDRNTLLLGMTSKSDGKSIGQFGEGYKLGTLALLREGCKVTIDNYGAKEVWTPKLVNSRKYGARILTFEVKKLAVWNKVPDNNLTIFIEGITQEMWQDIQSRVLFLQEYESYKTSRGSLLLDENQKGKIYVGGLFVCEDKELNAGYDFNPENVTLDRDRRLISEFDIKYECKALWESYTRNNQKGVDTLYKILFEDSKEITLGPQITEEVASKLYTKFKEEFGEDSRPIAVGDEPSVKENTKVVSAVLKACIEQAPEYEIKEEVKDEETLYDQFNEWYKSYEHLLTGSAGEEFEELLDKLEKEVL